MTVIAGELRVGRWAWKVLAMCALLPGATVAQIAEKTEMPANAVVLQVHSYGRVEKVAGGMYTYQWPGVYFLAAYHGPALYFRVGSGRQNLHILADGHSSRIVLDGQAGIYRIATPKGATHLVRIDVMNENQDGPKSLGEFLVEGTGKNTLFDTSGRQMEFIGDSYTVGYGNTSTSRYCTSDQVWATTDTTQSVGADLALHYNANYQINAISGRGVVRNYNGGTGNTVPVAYPFTLLNEQSLYRDPAWMPSVVAISLGTNDFSTSLHATEAWKTRDDLHAAFVDTYFNFIKSLRSQYPRALIVLWSTDEMHGERAEQGQMVVQKLHIAGDPRVDFVDVTGLAFSGCHQHPSFTDDSLIAARLMSDIDTHHDVWLPKVKGTSTTRTPASSAPMP